MDFRLSNICKAMDQINGRGSDPLSERGDSFPNVVRVGLDSAAKGGKHDLDEQR